LQQCDYEFGYGNLARQVDSFIDSGDG